MFITVNMRKICGILSIILGTLLVTSGIKNVIINQNTVETISTLSNPKYLIVVDAGHGAPDGGAVSESGIEEANINLDVALKLRDSLEAMGYDVIMTRESEENIADVDKQGTIREMKVSDINNRIKIVNNSEADMLISIHMNKFTSEKYYGWQTFYKQNSEDSKMLAEKIQLGISNNIDRENTRTALSIKDVKLIEKSQIPSVIVECGFLSNYEDLRLLQTDEYKEQIVSGIIEGVEEFYNSYK